MYRFTAQEGRASTRRRSLITAAPDPRRADWSSPAPHPRLGVALMLGLLLLLTCDSAPMEGGSAQAPPVPESPETFVYELSLCYGAPGIVFET